VNDDGVQCSGKGRLGWGGHGDSVVGSLGASWTSSGFEGGVTARHSWWLGLSGSRGSGHRMEWGRGGPVTGTRVVGADG
jgi:hypothetical protein